MSEPSEPFIRGGESSPPGSSPCSIQPCSRFEKGRGYVGLRDQIHREEFALVSVKPNEPRSRKVRYRVLGDPTIYRADTSIEHGVELFVHNDGTVVFSSGSIAIPRKFR
jgi:hypothetical protein